MAPRFVEEVKKQCADMDAQWDERQKTRAEETEAISKVPGVDAGSPGSKWWLRSSAFSIQQDENWGWNMMEPGRTRDV